MLFKFNQKEILDCDFYSQETVVVAQKLLGKYLVRRMNNFLIVGKIIETEAYLPFEDEAAHNYKGKTKRNEVLFGESGYAYVHSMRQYHCLDIVTEGVNRPGSV